MKEYVDLFILPIPKKNLAAYRRVAQRFGKIIEEGPVDQDSELLFSRER